MRSQKGVVDTSQSPLAILKPVPISAVTLSNGFWNRRLARNLQEAIPKLFDLLESHGVLDNFRRLYGAHNGPRRGYLFTDSDLYKWMEAAAFTLASERTPEIAVLLEHAIDTILPAQQEDGYLNTWFIDERADKRWTNLDNAHELYCAGHLIQAAIAHHRATGESRLLDCATRFADNIDQTFRKSQKVGAAGHPEIELALVELYRETRDRRYLDLAGYFLDQKGVTSRQEISGHAVRACYFMAGATDYYIETGDAATLQAIESQWQDMTSHKIYITGGIGGRYSGEAFGNAFELPNKRAYAETCAAIATIFWNWRMLQINGDARHADWIERALYNGFLSGVSLSGTEYFYMNPLASTGKGEDDPWYTWAQKPPYQRQPWYDCTCCPPNVQRLLASLPGYMYSTSTDGLWVHMFANNQLNWRLEDGSALTLTQETEYPWNGQVTIRVSPEKARAFSLFIRVPDWAEQVSVNVDGESLSDAQPGRYLEIKRTWQPDSVIELDIEMPVQIMTSDYRVSTNRGSVALQRGPIVYCLEGVDHDGRDVHNLRLIEGSELVARHENHVLDGITLIEASGLTTNNHSRAQLYQPVRQHTENVQDADAEQLPLRFVPYYAWANRGPTSMSVWVPLSTQPES